MDFLSHLLFNVEEVNVKDLKVSSFDRSADPRATSQGKYRAIRDDSCLRALGAFKRDVTCSPCSIVNTGTLFTLTPSPALLLELHFGFQIEN